jgi:hypothetical protein
MGLQVCSKLVHIKLVHILFERIPLHVQGAYVRCNHANGGGVGSKVNFKHLQEIKMNALIVCSPYNVS